MRSEVTRQREISLRPVIVFEFLQDARGRLLVAKNIGLGAAFNIHTTPLNVVPGTGGWDIHFQRIYSLASHEKKSVAYKLAAITESLDKGFLFFPQLTEKQRELRIEYQDVEGGRYRQDLTVHPKPEGSDSGFVTYASIQKLGAD
jgi:hypothetical protein